jgi:hypothetical protein
MLIDELRENPEDNDISWMYLSRNKNERAMELLQENQDKIEWENFSRNPAIFQDNSYVLK